MKQTMIDPGVSPRGLEILLDAIRVEALDCAIAAIRQIEGAHIRERHNTIEACVKAIEKLRSEA